MKLNATLTSLCVYHPERYAELHLPDTYAQLKFAVGGGPVIPSGLSGLLGSVEPFMTLTIPLAEAKTLMPLGFGPSSRLEDYTITLTLQPKETNAQ